MWSFDDLVKMAAKGRTRVGPFGKGCRVAANTYAIHYNNGGRERVAIRFYNTDIITKYPNGDEEIDCTYGSLTTKSRVNQFLSASGRLSSWHGRFLYFPMDDYSMGYEVESAPLILRRFPEKENYSLPIDHEKRIMFICSARDRLPLGKRWYFDKLSYAHGGDYFFIHRCERAMHGTKFKTSICSKCGENVKETFPDLETKMEAALNFKELRKQLNV